MKLKNLLIKDNNVLIGEYGPELVKFPDGTVKQFGLNGPEMVYLPKWSVINV